MTVDGTDRLDALEAELARIKGQRDGHAQALEEALGLPQPPKQTGATREALERQMAGVRARRAAHEEWERLCDAKTSQNASKIAKAQNDLDGLNQRRNALVLAHAQDLARLGQEHAKLHAKLEELQALPPMPAPIYAPPPPPSDQMVNAARRRVVSQLQASGVMPLEEAVRRANSVKVKDLTL